jgi:hypothetical protein
MRNEWRYIIHDAIDIERIRKYYELHANKLSNLDEMEWVIQRHKVPKCLNIPKHSEEMNL